MGESGFHHVQDTDSALSADTKLHLLARVGLLLASERSLAAIVQASLDAGLQLSGARFGAFFVVRVDQAGEPRFLCDKVAGISPAQFASIGLPNPADHLAETPSTASAICIDDLTRDSRTLPEGSRSRHDTAVRSYLAVPVRTREENIVGAFVYGHPEPAMFRSDVESLVSTVAAQAAVAMDRVRLTDRLTRASSEAEVARAAQRSTEQRLREVLEAAQLGTWQWNVGNNEVDFDERGAELFGVPPHTPVDRDEVRKRTILPEDLASSPENLRSVLRAGGKYSAEYRVRAGDGGQRWVASTGTVVFSESSGMVTGIIGTVQDITSRKTQEASLRTSEKLAATGRLAATIAHEINNPLEAVTNLIYLAKTDPATPSSIERMLETADGELARVSHIAQQTLGFYRDTTQPITIDLNDLLRAVVDLFDRKLLGKRVSCKLDLEPRLTVHGLQGEIRQVVSNLLVNAIDASTTPGAEIHIRGRHRHRNGDRGVSVVISDRGTGIPHHIRKSLFTPFITSKQSLGTGLGLWVTQGIVEKHGGTVRFRSRTDHPTGTVFRVYLPETGSGLTFPSPRPAILQ